MKLKSSIIFLLAGFLSLSGSAKEWIISDSNLEVIFDDQLPAFRVLDKRTLKIWEQVPFSENFSIKKVSLKNNDLNISFKGDYIFSAVVSLSKSSDLVFTLSADPVTPMNELAFPPEFIPPDKNYFLLMTDGEGYIIPVDDPDYPAGRNKMNSMSGLGMNWLGITDRNFETGYMIIIDSPDDAAIDVFRKENILTFKPVWLSTKGIFGYNRKAFYHFFDKGGYVAQCKKYRDFIWDKNNVITLRENQKKFPAIDKMIGAVHIYLWGKARELSFVKELRESGIDKAFILWDPNHTPYPEPDYDSRLKELGYATGVYEVFRDIHPRDSVIEPQIQPDQNFLGRTRYPGMYPEITVKNADGSVSVTGFGHNVCPAAVYPIIENLRIEKELKIYPHESYFIDVYQAVGSYECYDKSHPLTRTQYREEVLKIYKLLTDKYKTFCGGEWGADFTGSLSVYSHGMMTVHKTWFTSDAFKKNTIYYIGNWSGPRPLIQVGTSTATEKYLKYGINEYTRVPLFELVYHDANVTSWRWNDGNHKMPEIWWKKDLFNILYGNAPMWSIDDILWNNFKLTFIESYKKISEWIRQIGYDEMLSHRFLTDDHKVQETVFSSGKRIIVNFSDSDINCEGQIINAKGFITISE